MSATTLYVPIPAGRRLVRAAGGERQGRLLHRPVGPHVTVLWPFLHPDQIDPDVHRRLRLVAAAHSAFRADFGAVGRFEDVVYLAPDDPRPFLAITQAVVATWPQCPPYEGQFDTVVPHLSLGSGPRADAVAAQAALPVTAWVSHLHLAVQHRWRGWRCVARYPLGRGG